MLRAPQYAEETNLDLVPDQVISGAALGLDTALALVGFSLQIPLILAIPFDGQEELWPAASQERYKKMLELAFGVNYLDDAPYKPEKIQVRNDWMVNHADLILAIWDGRKSGDVWNNLSFAQFRGRRVKNLWEDWTRIRTQAYPSMYPIEPLENKSGLQLTLGFQGDNT